MKMSASSAICLSPSKTSSSLHITAPLLGMFLCIDLRSFDFLPCLKLRIGITSSMGTFLRMKVKASSTICFRTSSSLQRKVELVSSYSFSLHMTAAVRNFDFLVGRGMQGVSPRSIYFLLHVHTRFKGISI